VHYATSHPLYTYAFYFPRSKRILFRQDSIFLVSTFPMRHARTQSGLLADGEVLKAVRSPLASALSSQDELSFQDWQAGDSLPAYDDHATGISLHDDLQTPRLATIDFPSDWPRRFPNHPAFGPRSTIPVPVPPLFPVWSSSPASDLRVPPGPSEPHPSLPNDVTLSASSFSSVASPSSPVSSDSEVSDSSPADYSVRDQDRDLSRGMGHYLRWPHSLHSPCAGGTKRSHPNDPFSGRPPIIPEATPPVDDAVPHLPPTDAPAPRVLRPRLHPPSNPGLLPYTRPPRVPVAQRWFYEPVPVPTTQDTGSALTDCAPDRPADADDPLLRAEVAAFVSTLSTRAPRMPVGDDHADDMADLTWRRANPHWSATHDKFEAAVVTVGIPPVEPSRVPVGQRWTYYSTRWTNKNRKGMISKVVS
jgi:hypothetical protein